MTFDFETIIDRRGKDAVAVDAPAPSTRWQTTRLCCIPS